MLTVKVLSYDELSKEMKENFCLPNNGPGADWASYLIVEQDGKIIRVESSAMEPEDVSFYRDLKWVKDAIEEAYQMGRDTGYEEGYFAG